MTFSPFRAPESTDRPLPQGIRLRRGTFDVNLEDEQATFEVMQKAMGYTSNWAHHYSTRVHLRTAPQSSYWLAEECPRFGRSRVVGYAHSVVRDRVWSLTEFFVMPSHHRMGIGRALLNACLQDGAQLGADTHLVLASHHTSADSLYMRRAGCFPRIPMFLLSGPVSRLQFLPPSTVVTEIEDDQPYRSSHSSSHLSSQRPSQFPSQFPTHSPFSTSQSLSKTARPPDLAPASLRASLTRILSALLGKREVSGRKVSGQKTVVQKAETPFTPMQITDTRTLPVPTVTSQVAIPLSETDVSPNLIASPILLTAEIQAEIDSLDRDIVGYARPLEHRFWVKEMEVTRLFREKQSGRLVGYAYFGSHSSGPALAVDPCLLPPMLAHITRLLSRESPDPDFNSGFHLTPDTARSEPGAAEGVAFTTPDAYWAVAGTNEVMLQWLLDCGWQIVFQYLFMSSRPLGRLDRYVCHNPLYLL